jgi:hypothetical protein
MASEPVLSREVWLNYVRFVVLGHILFISSRHTGNRTSLVSAPVIVTIVDGGEVYMNRNDRNVRSIPREVSKLASELQ